jgi:hypothetical protein
MPERVSGNWDLVKSKQKSSFQSNLLESRYEEGRNPIDKIAQEIVDNNYLPEKIKEIEYNLASSAPNPVAGSSRVSLLRNKLQKRGADRLKTEATKVPHITTESNKIQTDRHIFDEDEGFECPEHYYLEKVQKRL